MNLAEPWSLLGHYRTAVPGAACRHCIPMPGSSACPFKTLICRDLMDCCNLHTIPALGLCEQLVDQLVRLHRSPENKKSHLSVAFCITLVCSMKHRRTLFRHESLLLPQDFSSVEAILYVTWHHVNFLACTANAKLPHLLVAQVPQERCPTGHHPGTHPTFWQSVQSSASVLRPCQGY